jgi:hypothetical protein
MNFRDSQPVFRSCVKHRCFLSHISVPPWLAIFIRSYIYIYSNIASIIKLVSVSKVRRKTLPRRYYAYNMDYSSVFIQQQEHSPYRTFLLWLLLWKLSKSISVIITIQDCKIMCFILLPWPLTHQSWPLCNSFCSCINFLIYWHDMVMEVSWGLI